MRHKGGFNLCLLKIHAKTWEKIWTRPTVFLGGVTLFVPSDFAWQKKIFRFTVFHFSLREIPLLGVAALMWTEGPDNEVIKLKPQTDVAPSIGQGW